MSVKAGRVRERVAQSVQEDSIVKDVIYKLVGHISPTKGSRNDSKIIRGPKICSAYTGIHVHRLGHPENE